MSLPQGAPGAAEMGTGQTLSVSRVRVAGVERCRDPVSGTSAGGRRLRQASISRGGGCAEPGVTSLRSPPGGRGGKGGRGEQG